MTAKSKRTARRVSSRRRKNGDKATGPRNEDAFHIPKIRTEAEEYGRKPKLAKSKEDLFVTIDGKNFLYTDIMAPLSSLQNWYCNPRFPAKFIGDSVSDDVRCLRLLTDPVVQELAFGMLKNGGSSDTLLGIPLPNGRTEVLDGSSRSAICKLGNGLLEIPDTKEWEHLKKFKVKFDDARKAACAKRGVIKPFPANIAIRILIDADPAEVKALLTFKHINLSNEWTSQAKGLYAYDFLRERLGLPDTLSSIDDLIALRKAIFNIKEENVKAALKEAGLHIKVSRPDRVRLYVLKTVATLLYEHIYQSHLTYISPKERKWNYFHKFYDDPRLRKLMDGLPSEFKPKSDDPRYGNGPVVINPNDVSKKLEHDFFEWISNGKVAENLHVANLAEIFATPNALKSFKSGNTQTASLAIDRMKDEQGLDNLIQDTNTMADVYEVMTVDEEKALNEDTNLHKAMQRLYAAVGNRLVTLNKKK